MSSSIQKKTKIINAIMHLQAIEYCIQCNANNYFIYEVVQLDVMKHGKRE